MSRPSSPSWLPPSSVRHSDGGCLGALTFVGYLETVLALQLWNIIAGGSMVVEQSVLRFEAGAASERKSAEEWKRHIY